ncbi:DSBA oxidoreductase [Corynebacterium frankenforstense DSM 45800]|uniref:DSBA oxidoreductase n=1 Tax=Corynebacterium frankenforstense DSM 45800 TaxID=1437875 RepID=A0A1L7CU81_9CORY|nr:DsbA family protein [Corynebacterium frankenforstense]APT89406.1 DSBA oxidoreductase [Corynebacterium frankenforstense DSM 45800]
MTQSVTFWFDVSCPFAWQTSRWMKEVEKVRDIEITWQPMSLSVLNDGRDLDPEYMKMMEANWGPARVFAAVATEHPEKVDELYTTMGELVHPGGQGGKKGYGAYNEVIAEALAKVGLSSDYQKVADTEEWDDALRKFHNAGIESVGDEVGTPVIKLGDHAFFGPVITRVPTGEEAGEIFDAAVRLAQFPYFFELKRSRTESPQV